MKNAFFFLLLMTSIVLVQGCKKDGDPETPPTLEFKTGAGYTATDAIVAKGAIVKVGVTIKKTEDDLKTFNVSVAFDGASATTSKQSVDIPSGNAQFDSDITITTRNQAGSEKWFFTITDVDGNVVQKTITLNVN